MCRRTPKTLCVGHGGTGSCCLLPDTLVKARMEVGTLSVGVSQAPESWGSSRPFLPHLKGVRMGPGKPFVCRVRTRLRRPASARDVGNGVCLKVRQPWDLTSRGKGCTLKSEATLIPKSAPWSPSSALLQHGGRLSLLQAQDRPCSAPTRPRIGLHGCMCE